MILRKWFEMILRKKTTFIEKICHNFENVGLTFSKITQT